MEHVYLEVSSIGEGHIQAPIETALCLCVYNFLEHPAEIELKVIISKATSAQLIIDINRINLKVCDTLPTPVSYCTLPVFHSSDELSCVAGLSAVLRRIVKCSDTSNHYLLGFREACLVACAETSVWTKFCEIELIACCKKIMLNNYNNLEGILPLELARLEAHMSLPIRVHNVGKLKDKSHKFAEGPYFLLTDLVLALPVHIILNTIGYENCSLVPLILAWYTEVTERKNYLKTLTLLHWDQHERWKLNSSDPIWKLPNVARQSLYKRDPTRYKPRDKIFTQQIEIEDSMGMLENVEMVDYSERPMWEESWAQKLPIPEVPNERLIRKRHQLANLAAAAINITNDGDIIVDFCSGSGHLGLILAYCLPKCTIILLDNKEKSLDRARIRLKTMNLKNVYVVQANLDYFIGKFQVGVSLHACGVASDLVIHKCLNSKANFVVCPCCYGGIQENHIVSYPQSKEYLESGLSQRGYIVLGHCADQAGTDQGEKGMIAVDSDRCLLARNRGYNVTLSKLVPKTCTTRNNIIVGVNIAKK